MAKASALLNRDAEEMPGQGQPTGAHSNPPIAVRRKSKLSSIPEEFGDSRNAPD